MVEIREAVDDDRDSAIRLMWKAFDATRNLEDLRKDDWVKLWNNPAKEDWAYVAVDKGKVVANLCFFASDDNIIRGRPVRFSGVWAVATEPMYRKQGLVRALFDKTFPIMRERGCCLSILDPFYRPFYQKFGYALAEKRAKHILKRNQFADVKLDDTLSIRELEDVKEVDKLREIEHSMSRYGSRFFHPPNRYTDLIKEGHFHIIERGSEPVGMSKFWFRKGEHAYQLTVGITRYKYDFVLPAIIDLVKKHSVNCESITWWIDQNIPMRFFLSDIHDSQSFQIGSMMMRVVDFIQYCAQISTHDVDTQVTVQLVDSQCKWNEGIYSLKSEGGRVLVESSNSPPDVRLDALQLSQVISGYTPVTALRNYGIINCSEDAAEHLEMIFPPDSFVSYLRF